MHTHGTIRKATVDVQCAPQAGSESDELDAHLLDALAAPNSDSEEDADLAAGLAFATGGLSGTGGGIGSGIGSTGGGRGGRGSGRGRSGGRGRATGRSSAQRRAEARDLAVCFLASLALCTHPLFQRGSSTVRRTHPLLTACADSWGLAWDLGSASYCLPRARLQSQALHPLHRSVLSAW